MDTLNLLYLALAFGLLFYIVIPGGGAFRVRNRWRRFRKRVLDATAMPELSYSLLRTGREGHLGDFRILGSLQAIQGGETIWVAGNGLSVTVNLSNVTVYTLPHTSPAEGEAPSPDSEEGMSEEVPAQMSWNRIFSLPEGTRLFIAGSLYREGGQTVFLNRRERPLLVLLYDGEEETILPRTVRAGRQRNEYLNELTPGSLITGCLVLLLLTYLAFRGGMEAQGRLILLMAMGPLLVYLPPGLLFYELYRIFWRRARSCRAERDLLSLPLRYWPGARSLEECRDREIPGMGVYGYRSCTDTAAARRAAGERLVRAAEGISGEEACTVWGLLAPETAEIRDTPESPARGAFTSSPDRLVSPLLSTPDPFRGFRNSTFRARRWLILSALSGLAGLGGNLFLCLWLLRLILS